jgi:hypothetical protein
MFARTTARSTSSAGVGIADGGLPIRPRAASSEVCEEVGTVKRSDNLM